MMLQVTFCGLTLRLKRCFLGWQQPRVPVVAAIRCPGPGPWPRLC